MTDYRSTVCAAALLLLAAPSALAQPAPPAPRFEVFGGYSVLPADNQDFPRATSHGVQASAAVFLTRSFGIVAEIAAQWSTGRDLGPHFAGREAHTVVREYLVGPRLVGRLPAADLFVHGLFGAAAGDAGPGFEGFSDTGLALGGGGGVDIHVHPRVSVRAQFDLLGSFADIVEANSRFSAGAVIGFGAR